MRNLTHWEWETAKAANDHELAKCIAIETALDGWRPDEFGSAEEFATAFCGSDDADIALGLGEWDRDGFGEASMDELRAAALGSWGGGERGEE